MLRQRYLVLKAAAADALGDGALALAWRGKHSAQLERSHPLPYLFPLVSALRGAGYLFLEDLLGATDRELVAAGLGNDEARSALSALTSGETMGYTMKNGRWANVESVVLAGSAARTADGNGDSLELGDRQTLRLKLDVTAIAGTTKQLDVAVQTRHDADDSWRTVASFSQKTAVASEQKCFTGLDREVRVAWTKHADTTSATFSVEGEAA